MSKNKKLNVVTIGGGTGSFMLLTGLKKYPINLSAIVSMADDGGSTGILRDELGVLPPGDVRQCLVALSNSSEMLRKLMNYRFESGGLKGHSFGNLFLSALEKITGDFSEAIEEAGKILDVRGEVIPVTEKDTSLVMELKNGKILEGEHEINLSKDVQRFGIKKNYLKPAAKANSRAIKKILEADLIVIGPGNHYCSVMPNLLVRGIPEAINKSKAGVVYISNLINKNAHTDGFTVADYVAEMNKLIGKERIDVVIFNSKIPSQKLLDRYKSKNDLLVQLGVREDKSYEIISADIISSKKPKVNQADKISAERSFIRHDGGKLARTILMIAKK